MALIRGGGGAGRAFNLVRLENIVFNQPSSRVTEQAGILELITYAMDLPQGAQMDNSWSSQFMNNQGLDTNALSQAITLGSLILQGDWLFPAGFALIILGLALLITVLVAMRALKYQQTLETTKLHALVQTLYNKIDASEAIIVSLQDQVAQPAGSVTLSAMQQQDGGSVDATLLCLDAKLLQLAQDNRRLQAALTEIMTQLTDAQHLKKLDDVAQEMLASLQAIEGLSKQTDKAVKMIVTQTQEISGHHKLTQVLGLDMKKGFQMAETMSDSQLKQTRESLQLLQSDNKSMGEKLTRLEGSADDLKNATKQNSLDTHVCKETIRQKLEGMHGEQKHFVGATNSNFRGLNVLIPQFKQLGDQHRDMLDYLSRANQHNTAQADTAQTTMESAANAEDRVVRVESLCTGLIDQVNELNEIMQQIRECQSLQQEQLTTIIERTPKLPKRSPPQENPQPTTPPLAQQPPPASNSAPQPQHQQVHLDSATPTLRLSEHLQPLVRETTSPIYMVRDPLSQVSTQDLLRTLLSRGGI